MQLYTCDSKVRKQDQLKMILGQGLYKATPEAKADMADLYACGLPCTLKFNQTLLWGKESL